MGINTNLDFKIGLLVEEKGLKLEDFEAKIKKFSNSIKVANSSIKSMTKSIEELNIVGTKIDFSKSLDNFSKQNDKILDKIKKSKEEFEKINNSKQVVEKQPEVIVPIAKVDNKYSKFFEDTKSKVKSLNESLRNFSITSGNAFKGLVLSSGPATKNIYEMSKAMLALNTSTGKFLLSMAAFYTVSAAIQGISESYKYIFKTASEFERLQTILNGLEGSSSKGKQSFDWIKQFAKDTPFELQEVMDSFVRLKSQGLDTNNLKIYGDTAAAMGKTVVQTVEAIMDAVQGENERLKEFGVKGQVIGEKMLYSWTTTSGKAKYAIVNNNAKIIESTLSAIFNEKYYGQTDALARTLEGSFNKVKDSFAIFANEIMTNSAVFNGTKEVLTDISNAMNKLSSDSSKMKELGVIFTGLTIQIIEGGFSLVSLFTRLTNGIRLLQTIFWQAFAEIKKSASLFWLGMKETFGLLEIDLSSLGRRISGALKGGIDLKEENKIVKEQMKVFKASLAGDIEEINAEYIKNTKQNTKDFFSIGDANTALNEVEKIKDEVINKLETVQSEMKNAQITTKQLFSDYVRSLTISPEDINQSLRPFTTLNEALKGSIEEINKTLSMQPTTFKYTPIIQSVGIELKEGQDIQSVKKDEQEKEKAAKKAKKEAERIKDSGLIDYYEVLGNKSKAAYEKMLKYVEGLKKDTYLTKSQIAEMTVKLEENLKVEEKISKSQSLSEYYEIIGETGKAAYENITQKMLELKLSGNFTEKQLIDINKALMKTRELDVEISSRDNLITYFRGVGNEAKALKLELDNEMASLSKSGQFDPQQLSDIKLNKEKELNKQITDMNASKREEELNKDMAYLIKKGDFKLAKEVELEERRKELLNKDLSPNQMLEEEARLISELDTKYQNLRITETDRMAKLKEGYSAYMEELSVRMNDYASLSKDVMTSFEGSLTNTFTSFFDTTSKSFLSLEQLGKSAMQGLLEAIKQAITKMIVLQAMNAAMGGVGGFGGGGFGGMFEKGGVFNGGNVQAFATGTVIDTPTYFPMSGNKTGLMGEAGPEAIMPLTRDSSGSLGVKLNGGTPSSGTGNIVINNYSNSNVRASQDSNGNTTITIEMLEEIDNRLASKVNSGNSSLDSILSKKYNMNKR